jgi:hypothetical protein
MILKPKLHKTMKKIFQACILFVFSLVLLSSYAEKVPSQSLKKLDVKSVASGCLPGGGFRYLDIGNVRTRINTGGDMWWDFESAQYEIPKGSGKMSMFAASLWIGGIDVNDQLKLAALRYRQVGNDYWPGPLSIDGTASVDPESCAEYDKHFVMTRAQVDQYLAWWDDPAAYPDYVIPEAILNWPAHGDLSKNQSYYLAPFYDSDGDGTYDPYSGDYPYYDLTGELCQTLTPTMDAQYYHPDDPNNWLYGILSDQVIKGDQTLWWVFNDKGNIHTETGGDAIGIEIRGQAFAFATNDEINNMTFYSYEIINRSTFTLRETYFSQWVDPDLGHHLDDYIGCDVKRGLGYCYNGNPVDGTGQPWAYGDQPPAIGVDFFQGPYMDRIQPGQPLYGQDRSAAFDENGELLPCDILRELHYPEAINGVNFGDGIPDNERFGMRRFTYFNNTTAGAQPWQTDPQVAIDYYNYLRGIWKDGERMVYGGNGHPTDSWDASVFSDFLFPGDSDPCHWGTGFQTPAGPGQWTEAEAGNPVNDRRFLQSAGPFTLRPGAVNYITVGIPWARAASGGPWASVELLRVVDDKCQALFDNCFQVVDGPNAPDLTFRELDKELIGYITNRRTNDAGNNFGEQYQEVDYNITEGDSLYVFEGYQVFQLSKASVGPSDLKDPNLARLVFQADIQNGVGKLINYYYDQSLGASVPVMEVNGADQGISNSFRLTQDAFTTEPLVNHKQYYYMALAYAYNEYEKYSTDPNAQVPGEQSLSGQTEPYLAGRRNIKTYTAIPHIPIGPTAPGAQYGDGVSIIRLQGQGNGGNILDFTKETVEEILSKPPADSAIILGHPDYPISYNPTYEATGSPVKVKVIDPLNVHEADFILSFDSMYREKIHNVTGGAYAFNPRGDTASMLVSTWKLTNLTTNEVYNSAKSILTATEQIFPELGIAIEIKQVYPPGSFKVGESPDPHGNVSRYAILAENNGFLTASMSFENNNPWLTGVPDIDGGGSFNWIRSGTLRDNENAWNHDWNMGSGNAVDPNAVYENLLGGTWAPYNLVAFDGQDPQAKTAPAHSQPAKSFQSLSEIASVDVVITSDKSKWTRSVVVEMAPEAGLAEGRTSKFDVRSGFSVDKDGNPADPSMDTIPPSKNPDDPNYISARGMGWFPGYAINLETGERLNIIFGENSWLVGENGRDMLWNPTSNIVNEAGVVFGGMHYIYIMSSKQLIQLPLPGYSPFAPAYDAGAWLRHHLNMSAAIKRYAWSTAMWVNMPITVEGEDFLADDVHIRLRVSKPYQRHYSFPLRDSTAMQTDTANNSYPMYAFNTEGVATITNDLAKAESDLDLINVVPNPYYAYSSYEVNQLDNRIKITNLPRKSTVTIYTANGILIRQFTKDSDVTSIDWDLKNYAGIPIAGGMYIIHVKADDLGEKTIKWFGSLRPVDLNAF